MGWSTKLLTAMMAIAIVQQPVYTATTPLATNTPAATTAAQPTTAGPAMTTTAGPSGAPSTGGPTTAAGGGQSTQTPTSKAAPTTTMQPAASTGADKTVTLTRQELITIICVSAGILTIMLVVSGVCGYCLTRIRHYRVHPHKPYNRHYDEENTVSDDYAYPPTGHQEEGVYVPLDGRPTTIPTGPPPPPYVLPRPTPSYTPYVYEEPARMYYSGRREMPERYYRSSHWDTKPKRVESSRFDRYDRSLPILTHEIPRAWI